MKLFQFLSKGQARTGAIYKGKTLDVTHVASQYNEAFFSTNGLKHLLAYVQSNELPPLSADAIDRYLSPVCRPSKIVCIGLNYEDHARETGAEKPLEPVLFLKSTTALCGPYDDIIIPKNSTKTDWEVELAVVIGKKASYADESDAMDYVAGYCLHNDVSERAFQLERGGTWDKGKGCDTFAPLGPYLVTPDEIQDVNKLRLWLRVNDTVYQDGNTSNLIFKIPTIIAYVSQFMTLLPGDIISTGTPAGVGMGQKPPMYLQEGDLVELGIDGIGVARQQVKEFRS